MELPRTFSLIAPEPNVPADDARTDAICRGIIGVIDGRHHVDVVEVLEVLLAHFTATACCRAHAIENAERVSDGLRRAIDYHHRPDPARDQAAELVPAIDAVLMRGADAETKVGALVTALVTSLAKLVVESSSGPDQAREAGRGIGDAVEKAVDLILDAVAASASKPH